MLRRFTAIARGMVVYPSDAARTSAARAAWSSRARCCWSSPPRHLARAGLRVGAAQRHARVPRAEGFKSLLLPTPTHEGADAGGVEKASTSTTSSQRDA
jgi:hypothetical protein